MKQFEIYLVQLDPTVGSEIRKKRPAVIVSPDIVNKHLNTLIVAPLTHSIKNYPSRVRSIYNNEMGEIALDQIRAVDKIRCLERKGQLDRTTSEKVKLVLQTMFS